MGKNRKFCDLSYATFEAFEKYINVEDCGIKYAPGKTCHIITKEERALMARYRSGERGLVRSNGYSFEPKQFHGDVLTVRHVHEHIVHSKVYYYTSNQKKFGLVYNDVDAHCCFQVDAGKALALLFDLFGSEFLFARDSDRGQNGYLKVWHGGRIDLFNDTLRELQRLLHLFFRQNDILSDIEIKGTITTDKTCGSLAKLPFSTFDPTTGRQSWNARMLEDFKAKPDLFLDSLVRFLRKLKEYIDVPRAEEFDRHVRWLKEQEKHPCPLEVEFESFDDLWLAMAEERWQEEQNAARRRASAAATTPLSSPPSTEAPVPPEPAVPILPCLPEKLPRVQVENQNEPDSFTRQFWALLPLHRSLRRVATKDEALAFIKANKLFTGEWSEKYSRREARVRWILNHHAKTFDPAMCGQGHVPLGQFDGWAKANFSKPIRVSAKCSITWEDVATYLAIFDHCIATSRKGDKGVPHNRIMGLWKKFFNDGLVPRQFKDKRVRFIRETLAKRDVIRITNREYTHDQSMTYDNGPNYPGKEFWRRPKKHTEPQSTSFASQEPSHLGAVHPSGRAASQQLPAPAIFVESKTLLHYNNKNNTPNTVPTRVGGRKTCWGAFRPSTGPPADP